MKKPLLFFLVLLFFCSLKTNGQTGFKFANSKKKKERVKFQLINNLIVVPLKINDKQMSFILDSGVSKTILFNITENDSLGLNNVKTVKLQGLGSGASVDALLSKNNKISLKNIVSNNETIYVILKDYFDLSAKMGVTIHGILGYDLLKDFVVKINYQSKNIDFYQPKKFKYPKCKKCQTFPINFHRKKPYIKAKAQLDTVGTKLTDVKMLIDTGGSDALWLFEYTKNEIKTPKLFFKDILGEGLSGPIYGNRSRIPRIQLGKFQIEEPTVSFLDSISTKNARTLRDRNGSIGAGILKRFIIWFDYPNQKLTLKKKGSLKNGFNYNMSGLDVVYNGKQLVREEEVKTVSDAFNQNVNANNSVNFISSFSYKFKPSYRIRNVVDGSPAQKAGLLKGDIILRINNTATHELTLQKLIQKFQEKDNKRIRMTIDRNGKKMKFEFRLQKKI